MSEIREAVELMTSFAERTGLGSERPQIRYLWTDAFAICNLLELARATGKAEFGALALRLVDRLHHTLGRHRPDDRRTGWISGLGEAEGEAHPTRGGLRIGKSLPERGPEEPFDEDLEWDRDGQYFHYLTKWCHALDQVSRFSRNPRFNLWARELAETSFAAFTRPERGRPQMVWKMSIDLSRPLVPSMGQHDPLDGYVTCAQLRSTALELRAGSEGPRLEKELRGFASMLRGARLETVDALGLGGLLADACRVGQLLRRGAFPDRELLPALLSAAWEGLRAYAPQGELGRPAARRLAFRELGLAIGLQGLRILRSEIHAAPHRFPEGTRVQLLLAALESYTAMGSTIRDFWLSPRNREARSWTEHREINEVMLATSLVPNGLLVLSAPPL